MLTVELRINGDLKRVIKIRNLMKVGPGNLTEYEIKDGDDNKLGYVHHVPENGMVRLVKKALSLVPD